MLPNKWVVQRHQQVELKVERKTQELLESDDRLTFETPFHSILPIHCCRANVRMTSHNRHVEMLSFAFNNQRNCIHQ